MSAYYNEFDPQTAAWLRELIAQGHIAPGDVDTRSIEDVRPDDLRGYQQCHFFAGIGVWSYALRRAGWPDDRPIWTGSCPCQPFSAAGKGAAFADERHLWPAFGHLIAQRRPAIVLGEQVASKAVDDWIDLVHADLETLGYAFGSVPFPSAGVGAPHIRDRNYWVASAGVALGDTGSKGLGKRIRVTGISGRACGADEGQAAVGAGIHSMRLADAKHHGRNRPQGVAAFALGDQSEQRLPYGDSAFGRLANDELQQRPHGQPGIGAVDETGGRQQGAAAIAGLRGAGGLGHAESNRYERGGELGEQAGRHGVAHDGAISDRPGPTNGFWRDADWLGCRDGKWRPVEPGTFPLVDGAAARVVRLRGYGNAINAEAAQAWIETVMECLS